MPKLHIQRETIIHAPVDRVFSMVKDFSHWSDWSPWLIMEPEASVNVTDDGSFYEWEGTRVGSGNMNITGTVANSSVDYDLTFLKPWKSHARVRFDLKREGNNTHVVWHMDTKLPFFLGWMKKSMTAYVSSDFDRGLRLLRELSEDGKTHSQLDFVGVRVYPGCTYAGIRTELGLEKLPEAMKRDFTRIGELAGNYPELAGGPIMSLYHKWDLVRNRTVYTAAIPVKSVPQGLPADIQTGSIPSHSAYLMRHTGPYSGLANAWSTLYSMQRNKEFKVNKAISPFEVYVNTPGEVAEEELITEIYFPVKA